MRKNSIAAFALGMTLLVPFAWGTELSDGYFAQGYLQSDGTAWIDTGYFPNERTRLEGVFEVKDMSGDHYLFGSSALPDVADRALWMETFGNGNGYVGGFGYNYKGPTGSLGLSTTVAKLCSLVYEGGVFTVNNLTDGKTAVYDGSTELTKVVSYKSETSFALFTRKHSDGSVRAQNPSTCFRRFTISEEGEVKRDFVPACRTEDLVLGLYDVQNNEFYTNAAASGAFSVGIVDEQKPGYHRLAYLESTGTQFIDTGYVFKDHPKVEARVMVTDGGDRDIMGTAKADPGCFIIDYKNGSKITYYRYSSTSSQSFSWSTSDKGIGTWKDCSWSDEVWHGDLKVGTVASYDFSANTQTFRLFRGRETGNSPGMLRIAWVRLYDGDELVRDYIPALVDGRIGLWNKLDGTLAENEGTGDFVVGPLIPAEPGDFTFLEVTGSPSAIGTTEPDYGRFTVREGAVRTCRAPTQVVKDGVRATLEGWTLFYDGAYQDEGPDAEIEVTAGSGVTTLQWRWSSEFYLTATNSSNGAVTDATGWKEGGSTVELTATPAEGCEFICWTGDGVTDDNKRDNPLAVTMDGPKTLKANFCSPNARRLAYIGSTAAQQYVNTEYVFTNKPAVVARMMMMNNADTDYLGMPEAKDGCFIVDYHDGGRKLYYRYSTSGYITVSGTGIIYPTILQNAWVDCAWSNVVWHGTDKLYTVDDAVWQGKFAQNTQTFHLFHARKYGQVRFASVKMYDGDEFVRDFIPAEIGGVTGLWDRRGRKFYANKNGGAAFEKGEVVPIEDGDFAVSHEITCGAGGTVEVSDPETGLGETLTLVARPDEGFAFAGWEGNVPAEQRAFATASFAVTSQVKARATFVETAKYVVDPSGAGDYTSLAEAVEALGESVATLVVRPGAYVADATVVVRGGITIAADAGAVLCATNDTSVLSLEHPLAHVSGLVISNGYTASSQMGGNVTMSAGIVEGCLITAGRMKGAAGLAPAAAGVYMTGGVLRDSVIRGNVTVGDNGGAVGVYAKGSDTLVENCDVSCNTNLMNYSLAYLVHSGGIKLDGGTVRNCFVTNNLNLGHGNLYVTGGGRVEDTVVADNVGGFYFDTLSGGGFVPSGGNAMFVRTTFARNSGYGVGGLYAGGTVSLSDVKAYGNRAARGGTDGNMDVRGCDTADVDFANPDERPVARVADVYLPDDTTDIREAVRRCADNGTVHVAAGAYPISGEVIVDRPVRIVGAGADTTSFYRDPSALYTRLFNLRHAEAVLEGVAVSNGQRLAANAVNVFRGTLRQALIADIKDECPCVIWNGGTVRDTRFTRVASTCTYSTQGTAANLAEAGAVLEDCLFEGNVQPNVYTAGHLVRVEGGRVSRCVFRDNRLMGSVTCCVSLAGPGVVESSLLTHNDGSWYTGAGFYVNGSGWEVRNCTVVSNLSEYAGAAVYWLTNNTATRRGSFVNCILYRNRCTKEKVAENFDVAAGNGTLGIDVTFTNCLFTTAEAAAAQGARAVNPLSGDPKFRNLSRRDYRLGPGSPCRNAGYLWDGADDPSVTDLNGRRLSQFGLIDVGCHAANRNGLLLIVR